MKLLPLVFSPSEKKDLSRGWVEWKGTYIAAAQLVRAGQLCRRNYTDLCSDSELFTDKSFFLYLHSHLSTWLQHWVCVL